MARRSLRCIVRSVMPSGGSAWEKDSESLGMELQSLLLGSILWSGTFACLCHLHVRAAQVERLGGKFRLARGPPSQHEMGDVAAVRVEQINIRCLCAVNLEAISFGGEASNRGSLTQIHVRQACHIGARDRTGFTGAIPRPIHLP